MANPPEFIEVQDLHREFIMGDQVVAALDGVSLMIDEGEFVSIMGPSGSGKSTLLYLLGGLDRPTEGHIRIRGHDITALDENALADFRRRDVGFVFQSYNLVPTMTALDNVIFPTYFAGVSRSVRRERAGSLLDRVGLGDRIDHKPTELSGGQQQRVAIARALINDPSIVLADEPTGNLDTHTGAEVMALLSRLNRDEGRTVVIVSHDPRVSEYASRSVHLLDGKIVDGAV
ncbi:MAG: ABC transporter ATP-binding protein [Anaerolineae bacterium]|nr:ABC transporter ATP-binding protein [Anaerolineae bacterium]